MSFNRFKEILKEVEYEYWSVKNDFFLILKRKDAVRFVLIPLNDLLNKNLINPLIEHNFPLNNKSIKSCVYFKDISIDLIFEYGLIKG